MIISTFIFVCIPTKGDNLIKSWITSLEERILAS